MSRVELHYGAATDVGQVREVNEDAYLAAPPLFVVADGMGGHDGGDVASRIVVEEFARLAEEGYDPRRGSEAVAGTLAASHDRITAYAEEQSRHTGRDFQAGTTAVVALLVEDEEGDGTALRHPSGCWPTSATPASTRTSTATSSRSASTTAWSRSSSTRGRSARRRWRSTRRVTSSPAPSAGPSRVDADYFLLPLPDAERLVLCSDGITEMIDDDAVAAILGEAADPRDAADRLVAEAVARRWARQRDGRRGRCDGIGDRACLRLRAAARESRAEVGSPAVTSQESTPVDGQAAEP